MPITPTTFDVLALAIQTRVMAVTGFPAERVVIDQREDDEEEESHWQADQYVVIRCGDERTDEHSVTARERTDVIAIRTVRLTLWTRLTLDEPGRDQVWLTDASLGHLRVEAKLHDAVLCFQPLDALGNWLVSEPIKPRNVTEPRKGRKLREWGRSSVHYEVSYLRSLDLTYQ